MNTEKEYEFKYRTVSVALANKFNEEYSAIMSQYTPEMQLVIATHIEQILNDYIESPIDRHKRLYEAEMAFYEKYGDAVKPYSDMQLYKYFQPDIVLAEKQIFSTEEWNLLIDGRQEVSEDEMNEFINLVLRQINLSRQFMLLNRKIDGSYKHKETQEKGTEQTRARQLLAIYFLLESQGIKHLIGTSMSAVARLVHLISNTPLTNIQNSDIYKKYREMPYYKKDKELLTDLKYIRPFFEDIALTNVIALIDAEIAKLEK